MKSIADVLLNVDRVESFRSLSLLVAFGVIGGCASVPAAMSLAICSAISATVGASIRD